ncbi:MAG TPA: UbiA family prenyltransferase [Nocardioides sp.]|nr:UbiA family prenyltransferase [Nocardioides sp.]
MTTDQRAPASGAFLQVLRAGHVRLAVLVALALAATSRLIHRPASEAAWIFATVLVGQLVIGWHNDLTDEPDDARHARSEKPLVSGAVSARTLWIALSIGGVALIPLATAVGTQAGLFYIGSVLVAMTGNVVLRTGPLSFVFWAGSSALLAFYLSHSGSGRHASGRPPQWEMVACFALIGIGIHVALALWGLVADAADGWTYLPLRLGRRFGATQTMAMVIFYLAGIGVAVAYVAHTHGFSR